MPLVDVILDNLAVASFLCTSLAELETMVWNAFRSVLTIDNDGPIGFRVLRKDDGRGNETRFTSSSTQTNGKELVLLVDSDFATMPFAGEWTVVLERHVTSTPPPLVRKGGNQIDVERDEATRREAERAEAARRDAERAEATRRDAERAEATRREAERAETTRREAERAEATRREAERAETTRREAERAEATRREAERAEAARRDAERAEAARREAEREARREADRLATARLEAERAEALRRASAASSPLSSVAASSSDRTPSKVKSSRVPSSTAAESPSAETSASSPARPKQRVPSSSSTSSSWPEAAGASAVPLRNTNSYGDSGNQAMLRSQSGTMPVSATMISECATYVELRIRIVEAETSSSSAAGGGGGGATTPQGYLHVFEQTADGSLEWVDCDERYQAARTRRATFVYRWDGSPILAGNDTTTTAATHSSLSGTTPPPPVGIPRGSSDRGGGTAAYIDPLQQRYNNNNNNNSAATSSSSIVPSLDGFSGVYHVDTIQAAKWRGSLRVLNRRNSSVFSVPFNIRCPPSYWMLLQQIASHMSVPERYLDLSFVCDNVDRVISICSDRDVMAMVTLLGQPNPIVHAVDVRV